MSSRVEGRASGIARREASGYRRGVASADYELVRLTNGAHSIRFAAYGETLHPIAGPAAEAEALYIRQLNLRERRCQTPGEFIVWDVGLGGGANALAAMRVLVQTRGPARIESFDAAWEPFEFAFAHRQSLGYFAGLDDVARAFGKTGKVETPAVDGTVVWSSSITDFVSEIEMWARWPESRRHTGSGAAPHAIMFDPFSPAKNPEMWTVGVLTNVFRCLLPTRPCALATYSRATFVRVGLLLAGFHVGIGEGVDGKEETTIAANDLSLLARPLDRQWRKAIERSHSAEPLISPVYRQVPMSLETWDALQAHPQFR
jgi:hypothetical protein